MKYTTWFESNNDRRRREEQEENTRMEERMESWRAIGRRRTQNQQTEQPQEDSRQQQRETPTQQPRQTQPESGSISNSQIPTRVSKPFDKPGNQAKMAKYDQSQISSTGIINFNCSFQQP